MKLDVVHESLLEWALLASGAIPRPLAHTMIAMLMSRTILAAVKVGVFEELQSGPRSTESLSSKCGMDRRACEKILRALSGLGYVTAGSQGYELTPMSRKWLGSNTKSDLTEALLHRYLDMKLMNHAEEYLRSGESVDFHRILSADDWRIYMSGQRAQAALTIPELVKRTPLPEGGITMLDLGGGHGLFADAMCRKHPGLQAAVLDLPEALDASDHTGLSDRIRFIRGDVLETNLETDRYDLVFAGNLLHHFDESRIREIVLRAASSLKSGGVLVVADFFEFDTSKSPSQIPALLDFYFAVTSGGGALSPSLLKDWMREARLDRVRVVKLQSVPGMGLVIGTAK
ncbi:MAG TPA: class I SAM-dependent methyltransferase [Rhodothermia bacterium]